MIYTLGERYAFIMADTVLSNLFSFDDGSLSLVNNFFMPLVNQMLCVGERVKLCIILEAHGTNDCQITVLVYGVFYRTSV